VKNKNIIIFVLLSAAASFLNYATYPALARALPESQFINITVALSLLTQMSTILSSIIAISTSLTKEKSNASFKQIEILQSVIIYLLFAVILVFLLLSPMLLPLINLSGVYLLPVCIMLLLAVPISIISGYLNGKKLIIKLGLAALASAFAQFVLSVSVGFATNNSVLALMAMATGQLISVAAIYIVYKGENLPHIKNIFYHRTKDIFNPSMRAIIKFTILSSLGVMFINILQILDLLAVQNRGIDESVYTDLYIVSRVVFFAGTIFVWPFIASTELKSPKSNVNYLLKLVGILTILTLLAAAGIMFFGSIITQVLVGRSYDQVTYNSIGLLSILYKYLYIILYALVLYFTVMRSYFAVYLPLLIGVVSFMFTNLLPSSSSTKNLLIGLNLIAFFGVTIGTMYFMKNAKSPKLRDLF
jgi:O-antigen/teichoic acid export membrane protein